MAVAEREHAAVEVVDLGTTSLRELNQRLHDLAGGAPGPRHFRILNPSGRMRSRVASMPRSRSRSTGTWGTTAPG